MRSAALRSSPTPSSRLRAVGARELAARLARESAAWPRHGPVPLAVGASAHRAARVIRPRAHSAGFTLLEILLALVLLALLLAGAFGGIAASVRGMRSGEAAINRVDKVRTVQEFLRHQISRTLPFPYNQQPQTGGINRVQPQREIFDGRENFMRFVAPMPGYLSHGGAYVQTLELRPGEDGLQLVFTTSLLNGYSLDKSAKQADTVVLLEHISEGKFSYRGLDQRGQMLNWTSAWPDRSATPLLVGIDVTLLPGQIGWPPMAIALQMDATAQRLVPGLAQ
ncbi:MAG: prepilin-type N-terminal cleavage/methylation domain-containing protein [Rudaea sp.]